jgi:hypothetical protein
MLAPRRTNRLRRQRPQPPIASDGCTRGWIKKVERHRQGKIWVGFFHLWVTDASGRRIRQKKEKTLGHASMPKHEAQQKLAEYIEEYIGRIAKRGDAITTFADLWNAY